MNLADMLLSFDKIDEAMLVAGSYLESHPDDADILGLINEIQEGVEPGTNGREGYIVSALVSCYNSEKFLPGCLDDLESQTIADRIEIIVIDKVFDSTFNYPPNAVFFENTFAVQALKSGTKTS